MPDRTPVITHIRLFVLSLAAGLDVTASSDEFPVRMPTRHYLDMVRARYMSLLIRFTDDELTAGMREIRRNHPGDQVEFRDRFIFVVGCRSV